ARAPASRNPISRGFPSNTAPQETCPSSRCCSSRSKARTRYTPHRCSRWENRAACVESPSVVSAWSAPRPERHHLIVGRLAAHQALDVICPALQSVALLGGVFVTLVDAHDAAKRAALMVETLLDHRQSDAERRHAGCGGAPEIVKNPRLLGLHRRIERGLGGAHVAELARLA